MEKHEEIYRKKLKLILWHNFLGGIAWGLGITIGAGIILALGGFILAQVNLIPIIGTFIGDIVKVVQESNPRL